MVHFGKRGSLGKTGHTGLRPWGFSLDTQFSLLLSQKWLLWKITRNREARSPGDLQTTSPPTSSPAPGSTQAREHRKQSWLLSPCLPPSMSYHPNKTPRGLQNLMISLKIQITLPRERGGVGELDKASRPLSSEPNSWFFTM